MKFNILSTVFILYTDSGHDAEFDCGDGRGACRLITRGHWPRQRVGFDTADGMARVAEIQVHHGLRNVSRRMCQVCEYCEYIMYTAL